MSVELGKVICVLDPEQAEARNQRMVDAGADPARALPPAPPAVLADGVVHRGAHGVLEGSAGSLSPQFPVSHHGATGPFDEIVGHGFAVITVGGGDPREMLDAETLTFLDDLGAHLVPIVTPGTENDGQYGDVDLAYTAYLTYLTGQSAQAIVVRPDFYVYGATADLADLPALIADLRTDLQPPTPIR